MVQFGYPKGFNDIPISEFWLSTTNYDYYNITV